MKMVADVTTLSDKRLLKDVRYGVYVMQDADNPQLFRAGALGINDKNNSALARLRQCIGHKWQYVFFSQTVSSDHLYAAETILHGRLCEAFRGTGSSQFMIDVNETVEQVQKIAGEAIHHFMMLPQYSPNYLCPGDD